MNIINKQKFLAELGRLLTFMFEEDRQETLSLYSHMFDSASEEQALLQFLLSPTRQAVIIARAYQGSSGKLQIQSTSRGSIAAEEGTPSFILAIDDLFHEAELKGIIPAAVVDENQFSMFEDLAPERFDELEELGAGIFDEYDDYSLPALSVDDIPVSAPVTESEPELTEPAPELTESEPEFAESEPVPESLEPELEDETAEHEQDSVEHELDLEAETEPIDTEQLVSDAPAAAENELPAALSDEVEAILFTYDELEELSDDASLPAETEPAPENFAPDVLPAEVEPDPVDRFLDEFSIADISGTDESAEDVAPIAPAAAADSPAEKFVSVASKPARSPLDPVLDDFLSSPIPPVKQRKLRPLILILYILLAIPVSVGGIILLLIPTLLFLIFAFTALTLGVMLFTTAFGGFTMVADLLLVLGGSLVALAIGMLFAWLFIWLICAGIIGLIRGIIRLGKKWCFKEVDA